MWTTKQFYRQVPTYKLLFKCFIEKVIILSVNLCCTYFISLIIYNSYHDGIKRGIYADLNLGVLKSANGKSIETNSLPISLL